MSGSSSSTEPRQVDPVTEIHERSLRNLREFLKEKTCYDILPESFRLIVFDNALQIKKALTALMTNGVVSAPLYDSTSNRFSGMFTLTDVIHLIQYFYLKTATAAVAPSPSIDSSASPDAGGSTSSHAGFDTPDPGLHPPSTSASPSPNTEGAPSAPGGEDPYALAAEEVESFPLSQLREIEAAIEAPEPPTISILPDASLFEACESLVKTHARRIPLIDTDKVTGRDAILCVLTQYRTLKFIAINAQSDVARLNRSIGSLGIGSYVSSYQPHGAPAPQTSNEDLPAQTASYPFHPLATATLDTTVFDVVHMFSERGISAVPIIDEDGVVINMYEAVDIVDLVRSDAYRLLDLTIAEAIARRTSDFGGVTICSPNDTLANIMRHIGECRVHRFVLVDDGEEGDPASYDATPIGEHPSRGRQHRPSTRGRLVGMLTLSDVMRYIVGHDYEQKVLAGKQIFGLGLNGEGGAQEVDAGDTTIDSITDVPHAAPTEAAAAGGDR